jgi:hypothetical protein
MEPFRAVVGMSATCACGTLLPGRAMYVDEKKRSFVMVCKEATEAHFGPRTATDFPALDIVFPGQAVRGSSNVQLVCGGRTVGVGCYRQVEAEVGGNKAHATVLDGVLIEFGEVQQPEPALSEQQTATADEEASADNAGDKAGARFPWHLYHELADFLRSGIEQSRAHKKMTVGELLYRLKRDAPTLWAQLYKHCPTVDRQKRTLQHKVTDLRRERDGRQAAPFRWQDHPDLAKVVTDMWKAGSECRDIMAFMRTNHADLVEAAGPRLLGNVHSKLFRMNKASKDTNGVVA